MTRPPDTSPGTPSDDGWDGIEPADRARIETMVTFLRGTDTESALEALVGAGSAGPVAEHCRLDHVALLVFPRSIDALVAALGTLDIRCGEPVPSVVVRARLSRRYGIDQSRLRVEIIRATVDTASGDAHELELFVAPADARVGLRDIATAERTTEAETHLGFAVDAPDPVVVTGVRGLLAGQGYQSDGGGHNRHVDVTVLYFRNGRHGDPLRRRIELMCAGDHPDLLVGHLDDSGGDPAERLLGLLTGAWTTQALATAAELGLADRLADGPLDVAELAERVDADPDSLDRLLRFLGTHGVVARRGARWALTPLGELLRSDAVPSLHALALIYGGPFYTSFGALTHTVRTGEDGFAHVFGAHHFEYFARHDDLAALFDRAMAASAALFETVAEFTDFADARVVVDVAGGNGTLLAGILARHPHLRGVLVERPHAVAAAAATFASAGCPDRVRCLVGDFTERVPAGGDVYLLSRVLHDWDDLRCATILDRCAAAMDVGDTLLVVERLIPEDGGYSLAVPWDLHMLCNVGGRERTAGDYRTLLARAGFELIGVDPLPLDAALLRAVRVAEPGGDARPADRVA